MTAAPQHQIAAAPHDSSTVLSQHRNTELAQHRITAALKSYFPLTGKESLYYKCCNELMPG